MGIFLSMYPTIYAATFLTGKDRGGVMMSEISVLGGFLTFIGTGFICFAIATLLMSSNILSLPILQLLFPLSTKSLSATTYLKASLNWIASGLSLNPSLPQMKLNRFSAQLWLSLLVKMNPSQGSCHHLYCPCHLPPLDLSCLLLVGVLRGSKQQYNCVKTQFSKFSTSVCLT